jgi:hypothetical protein
VKKKHACLSANERAESLNDFVSSYVNADEFESVQQYEDAVLNAGAWDFKCDISDPAGDPYAKAEEMEKNGSGEVQENGYKFKTTFWNDFTIADKFGLDAVKDTFKRAFAEWRSNVIYLTEFVLVLNWKIYYFDGGSKQMKKNADEAEKQYLQTLKEVNSSREKLSADERAKKADEIIRLEAEKQKYLRLSKYFEDLAVLYDKLWKEADEFACNNLKGVEIRYFYDVTD